MKRNKRFSAMYLSFISDIAKPGDLISIECNDAIYQGIIVKLSDAFVAIKLDRVFSSMFQN